MLILEQTVEIKILYKQGKSIRKIAKETGYSRNTIKKYLLREESPKYKRRAKIPSKLDNYKSYLENRVNGAKPHVIPATVLFREIQQKGYQGKLTILREFLLNLKADNPEKIVRYETKPGEQMQVDWWEVRKGKNPLYGFVAILGFSRKAFIEFTTCMNEVALLRSHQNAFEHFGGVPEKILYDNMKTVVIQRNKYGKGDHGYQKTFLDFAKHYGFIPKLCRPKRPQTKGKVERAIQYIQKSFYYPLITLNPEINIHDLNYEAKIWLKEVADRRKIRELNATVEGRYLQEAGSLRPIMPNYPIAPPQEGFIEVKQHSLSIYEEAAGCL